MYYSKWETKESLLENPNILESDNMNKGGVPIYYDNKLYYNTKIYNTLVIGNKDSNKENNFIMPTIESIINANESLLLYDINDLYEKTVNKFKDNSYNIIKLDLNNLNESNKWNPLLLPFNIYKNDKDKANDLLDEIGYYLFNEKNVTDPFWINSAISYFKGLVLYMFNYEEEISFKKLIELNEQIKKNPKTIKEKISITSDIYNNISSIIDAPPDTKMSIIAVFSQKIKAITAREKLCNYLSTNDIDLNNLSKTVIFLTPKNNYLSNNICSMFISQLYYCLDKQKNRFHFILNDFANLYPIYHFESFFYKSTQSKISFLLTVNGLNELYNVYGKEIGEIIKGNCGNLVYLLSNNYETLEEISKLCGKKDENNYLISIEELKLMNLNEAIILILRFNPIKTILKEN